MSTELREYWATCGCKFILPQGHPMGGENGSKCAIHGKTGAWAETAPPNTADPRVPLVGRG